MDPNLWFQVFLILITAGLSILGFIGVQFWEFNKKMSAVLVHIEDHDRRITNIEGILR